MLNELFIMALQVTDDEALRYEIVTGRRALWNNPGAAAAGYPGSFRSKRPLATKRGGR